MMTHTTRTHRTRIPGFARLAALVLTALTLCAFLAVRPVRAAEWMTPYLEQVQEWGVMRGDAQGNLNEDRNITRAEFVTLVNRAFGYTDTGPNTFTDVNPNDWFAEDISIAHQAGYFNGTSPTTASPYALVTREQAAVFLGRCLRFQGVAGAANSTFTDMHDIGGWSRGLVQEAADLGIIQGYADGSFRPDLPITRGQMACFLVRALGTLVQEPGEQTSGGVYGNLTITTPGVKLKDTTVTGNLYLTGGVGLGNVELENVNVLGKIVICGGGEAEGGKQSVLLRNVTAGSLELDSLTEQFLSVQAEGLTNIAEVTIRTSGYVEDRTEDGLGFQTIRLDGIDGARLQLAGNIKRVIDLTPNSILQVAQGVADMVTIDEKAVNASLSIDGEAVIRELNLDRGTPVTGNGSISHLNINAAGSNVSMLPDTIYVRPGINGIVNNQTMDTNAAAASSEDPRLLAGYPKARNIAPTSADAVFRTNKTGTIHWAVTALMDGSLGEEELMNPGSYAKIIRSGTLNATAPNTDFTARLTGLTREGSYYISALLVDARGRRSPVKIAAFTTPDDSAPNFANGYPQNPILTVDADNEQVAQVMVMATKDCQMYYVLLPRGSAAPTPADFRSAALPGNLGYGIVTLRKNTPFLLSRINTSHLQEQTQYDLYLWLNDADNGKSSAVRRLQFTTRDMTPPTIQDLKVVSYTATSVTLSFMLDEPGTLNWAVTKRGDNFGINKEEPTRLDQIKIEGIMVGGKVLNKGGPIRAARAATSYNFTVSRLEGQTEYDLFYSFKDTAGNYGVYNAAIAFPFPIKTQDNQRPTADLSFSDFNTDSNEVEHPWATSSVSIVFSESILGAKDSNLGVYDNFYELYQRVTESSGTEQTQAKNTLATVLQEYITLYRGTPPTNINTKPRPENQVTVRIGQAEEELEALADWIDYREAQVSQENGKTTITFPGETGLKLQSGQSYYFWIRNVEDTSNNAIVNPTYKPFTTAFATVTLAPNEIEETVTYNGETRPARIFRMDPEGTEAVSKDTRWDMIIWSYASIEYDLMVRYPNAGATGWYNLGTISANLTGAGTAKVYNSLNGNFNNGTNNSLLESGFFGTVQAGQGRPFLNEFLEELEFAIVPTQSTVEKTVRMEVQLFAGSNSQVGNLARIQGKEINSSWEITPIGDPDPYVLAIDPPDEAPKITVGYRNITTRANYATISYGLSRMGTVYAAAIPLDDVKMDPTTNHPTGTDYTMHEDEPRRLPNEGGGKPDLKDLGNSLTSPVPHIYLDSTKPVPLNVVQQRGFVSNTTRFANTDTPAMQDTLRIENLASETTYLVYLVAMNEDGTPSENALCFVLTTTPPDPPKMDISGNGNSVDIQVKPSSQLRYVLVNHRELAGTLFNQPFQEGAAFVDTSRGPLPSAYTGTTVLDAMMYLMPNDDPDDVGTNYRNSLFDLYATTAAKQRCWEALGNPQSTTNFPAESVVMETLPQHANRVLNGTGSIDMESYMKNQIPYVLIVGAKPSDSDNYAFQASGDYIMSITDQLSAICVYSPIDPNNPGGPGYLDIIFNQEPTYSPNGALADPPKIDSCGSKLNGHTSTTPVNNFVNLGSFCVSLLATLESPTPNVHGVSIGTNLRYYISLPSRGVLLNFQGGLANAGGVPVKTATGGNAALMVTIRNDGTNDQPNWRAHWSQEFGGDYRPSDFNS
ncbi:MAG: S-layer homology domain-containing protein [Oscillibacter sp.]|nr:S-layer homology domain-containing protein [Oscillibacter sp.]